MGCSHPNGNQYRVLTASAVKTFLMTLPYPREYEHLAPSERRSFAANPGASREAKPEQGQCVFSTGSATK
jgi:hypothetical protein